MVGGEVSRDGGQYGKWAKCNKPGGQSKTVYGKRSGVQSLGRYGRTRRPGSIGGGGNMNISHLTSLLLSM